MTSFCCFVKTEDTQNIAVSTKFCKLKLSTRKCKRVASPKLEFDNFGASWWVEQVGEEHHVNVKIKIHAEEFLKSRNFFYELRSTNQNGEEMVIKPWEPFCGAVAMSEIPIKPEVTELTAYLKVSVKYSKIVAALPSALPSAKRSLDASLGGRQTDHTPEKKMRRLFGDSKFADFTFIIKGKEFKVHKVVLSSESCELDKMLENDNYTIESIEPNIFHDVLRFIYCAELPDNINEVALDLCNAADFFGIKQLKTICALKVPEALTVNNAVELLDWATDNGLEDLENDAWNIVKRQVLKIGFPLKEEPIPTDIVHKLLELRKTEKDILDSLRVKLPNPESNSK